MMMDSNRNQDLKGSLPLVFAVVLNWNGGRMNRVCLDSLDQCTYPNLRTVFVDNGSRDGSAMDIKARYPDIDFIFLGENLGFTGGNNRGIRYALEQGADMVLILNNDVQVSPGFLSPLVDLLVEKPGIVGPKIFEPGGKVWCAGAVMAFHQNLSYLRGFGQADNDCYNRLEEVDYMPACCLLVSREVFDAIGSLAEDYFCYLEDADFCIRARKAGFPVSYCPESTVVHHFSHSTGGGYTPARKYMNALNSVRFLKAHGTCKTWLAFWVFDVLALPPLFMVRLFQGRARGVLAKGRGILEGLAGGKVTRETMARFLSNGEDSR